MAIIRFLSPDVPQLVLDGVPARFVDGVFDVPDTDVEKLSRIRYLGVPFGVLELGALDADSARVLSAADVADAIADPASAIGAALRAAVPVATDVQALRDDIAQLKQQVASLVDGGGSRLVYGTTLPDATSLPDGTRGVLLSAAPTT